VGLRAGLNGCGKSRRHRDSIPGPPSPLRVAIPTELSGPTTAFSADSKQALCVAECASAAWHSTSVAFIHKLRNVAVSEERVCDMSNECGSSVGGRSVTGHSADALCPPPDALLRTAISIYRARFLTIVTDILCATVH
jgi:hypothetical protein